MKKKMSKQEEIDALRENLNGFIDRMNIFIDALNDIWAMKLETTSYEELMRIYLKIMEVAKEALQLRPVEKTRKALKEMRKN